MKNLWKHVVAAGLAVAVIGAGVTPASADVVKDRQMAMKSLSKANKALGKAAKAGDAAAAQKQAMMIVAASDKLEALFPKGSGAGYGEKHQSKADIWKDWDKFQKANAAMKAAAQKVASGDLKAAGDIGKTCGGCHKPFRGPKIKKKM